MSMLINTLVGIFCTFISKQPIILSVYNGRIVWIVFVCLQPARINSDSLAAQISTALVKRVKRHDWLTVNIGYIIHVEFVGGSGDVYIDVTFSL